LINGLTSLNRSLKEINDVIDTINDQLILEVESSFDYRYQRNDSISSFDTRENSPVRSLMDYHYYPQSSTSSYRPTPTIYSTSTPSTYNRDNNSRYMDSYGRTITNPLPAMFRTAAMASSNTYDAPRNFTGGYNSGYISDTNDHRRSSSNPRPQPTRVAPTTYYASQITSSNDPSYFSDSEYVTSGPKFYKITRQAPARRPSNVVLPIRSITSKAYDQYVPPESPKSPKQMPFDVYRYQQEQNRFQLPPKITLPTQDQRRKSDSGPIDHELGAELLKSPIANKKRYADSSFFSTPFNTYPTIEEQKKMAKKIAAILEGGDPTQKGASKFEKQRQRAEKYTIEAEAPAPTLTTSSYRPLRSLQSNDHYRPPNHHQNVSADIPECIKHSLSEAQYVNPLRFVGAPEEFKQIHMQEHVTHTNIAPQAAMSLVADLNSNRGKGAAIFQKRKARSEKWVVDENNVKKSNYKPVQTHISPTTKPWGQHAPASWSGDEGPSYSPVRPKFNLPPPPPVHTSVPEPIIPAPTTPKSIPRFGDFNAKPRGFGTWNAEASHTPRGSIDSRKAFNLNMGTSTREAYNPPPPALFSPPQSTSNDYFQYPTDNIGNKWKGQDYSAWNQRQEEHHSSQIPMTRDGVDLIRQRLLQGVSSPYSMSSSVPQQQQQQQQQQMFKHFTDL